MFDISSEHLTQPRRRRKIYLGQLLYVRKCSDSVTLSYYLLPPAIVMALHCAHYPVGNRQEVSLGDVT